MECDCGLKQKEVIEFLADDPRMAFGKDGIYPKTMRWFTPGSILNHITVGMCFVFFVNKSRMGSVGGSQTDFRSRDLLTRPIS